MQERRQELATLIVRENGKAMADALAEVDYAADFFRWFSEEAVRVAGELRAAPNGDKRLLVSREPIGVALLITPWNFPAAMITRKLGPALAAGCTTVVKPASETPLSAHAIAGILAESGLPSGAVNIVTPQPVGPAIDAMLAEPAIRTISFTGSTEVGVSLLQKAAPRVLRCSMELGGNAPVLILSDADLEVAVRESLVAKMRNGGASCIAANRFYVHHKLMPEFVERFAAEMSTYKLGNGLDPATQLGPVISPRELKRLTELVDAVIERGSRIVCGGRQVGNHFLPTVLDGVPPDDEVLRHEVFGPVAPVVEVGSDEEALALANDASGGLAAYVFARDLGHALRVSGGIEAGVVGINRGLVSDPAAPFGGVKESGLGREGGGDGILEFLETKYTSVDWATG